MFISEDQIILTHSLEKANQQAKEDSSLCMNLLGTFVKNKEQIINSSDMESADIE